MAVAVSDVLPFCTVPFALLALAYGRTRFFWVIFLVSVIASQ